MPVVWSDQCRLHEPAGEIFVGVRTPGTEVAARLGASLVPGTWEAARAAADAALTAVDLVLGGEPCAYACCRPPGHHAGRRCYGGSCYLNNAAMAAAALRERLDGPVAVLDLDAHHGNGTQ